MKIGLIDEPLVLLNNFTGVVIGLTHSLLPFMVLTLMAVIQRIDRSLEEASMNLGASPMRTFLQVVLPLSRPGLVGGYLLVLTMTISAFTTPAVLGGRRVLVMPVYIEQQIRHALQYGFGATLSTVLLVTALLLTVASLYGSERKQ
jgi:putative spermidine/putrescine transport system permease protein